jgi:hypothetical protein
MVDQKAPWPAKIAAAIAVLDRGWGKPTQAVEANEGVFDRMTDDEQRVLSPLLKLSRKPSGQNLTSCPIGPATRWQESDPKRRGSSAGMHEKAVVGWRRGLETDGPAADASSRTEQDDYLARPSLTPARIRTGADPPGRR